MHFSDPTTASVLLCTTSPSGVTQETTGDASPLPLTSSPIVVPKIPTEFENNAATFFDVAVVRCLFISYWGEEGVFWALTYLNKR